MDQSPNTEHLKELGNQGTEYTYEGADASLLEKFANPMQSKKTVGTVTITSPEFTSLCPKTGQPDFATIVVEYQPREWCVESKSWKLYLGSFRNHPDFHESCVQRIADSLIDLLDPEWLRVRGEFTPRGGIPFWPTVEYYRPFEEESEDLSKVYGPGNGPVEYYRPGNGPV